MQSRRGLDKAACRRATVARVARRYFAQAAFLSLALPLSAFAQGDVQLNQNCTVSILNRNMQVGEDGSWVLPNVPANFGPVRARGR
ncbi:MAG: hypothetical protein ABSD56_07220 [Bryobacteraceae bacterium]